MVCTYDLSQKSPVEIIMVITAAFFFFFGITSIVFRALLRIALKGNIRNVFCLFVGVGSCV